ncbi:hypothetical protein SCUP515_06587 [Seiridium cupressi]
MCCLQSLVCYICKMKLMKTGQYELREAESTTYVLEPCDYFSEIIDKMKKEGKNGDDLRSTGRFHCPNIQWPPKPNMPTRWVCEDCLCHGYRQFRYKDQREEAKKALDRTTYRQRHTRTPSISGSDGEDADTSDDCRHLPHRYQTGLKADVKRQLLKAFEEDYDVTSKLQCKTTPKKIQMEIDDLWTQRASEAKHRALTLYIPRCNLCSEPMVMRETTIENIDDVYLADIEYEPNGILWKWLFALAPKGRVQVEIRTGFITKPCDACIEKEFNLRKEVSIFLEKHSDTNSVGWMVFNWLLSRGVGNIPMFQHATISLGYPNTRPPTLKEMLGLMAESWNRLTGVAWEDVGDLQPPTSCTLSIVMHENPLKSLRQWPQWHCDVNETSSSDGEGSDDKRIAESTSPEIDDTPKSQTVVESSAGEREHGLLLLVKGAYFDEATQKSVRKEPLGLQSVTIRPDQQVDGDTNMPDSGDQMPELEEDTPRVAQCDMGHDHVLETGDGATVPGEIFTLPLGSH